MFILLVQPSAAFKDSVHIDNDQKYILLRLLHAFRFYSNTA